MWGTDIWSIALFDMAASLASLSAFSFPKMPTWLGVQQSVICLLLSHWGLVGEVLDLLNIQCSHFQLHLLPGWPGIHHPQDQLLDDNRHPPDQWVAAERDTSPAFCRGGSVNAVKV